ncbi:MAG TPA: hypothetical protein VGK38_08630, partial [Prolixibacteraceae bacterium]
MKQPAYFLFKFIKIMASKPFSAKPTMLVIAFICIITQNSVGQYGRRSSGEENLWEVGISGGVSQFLTTINPNSDAPFKKFNYWNADMNPAITISAIKNFSPKFSAEFEFLTTKLSGTWNPNNGYPVPPLALDKRLPHPDPFKTGINQFTLMFVPNLNQIIAPNSSNNKWYVFAKIGAGASFLKEYKALYAYSVPGNKFEYALVYGGGLSYKINDNIKLKIGANWYRVETDRLDGVHTVLPGVVSLKPGANPPGIDPHYFNTKE